jgi:endothelin-converting enzyme/putative endopeptidase
MLKHSLAALTLALACAAGFAQTATTPATPPAPRYQPIPSFDLSSMDQAADPCSDFYQFACGHYDALHPIPADQGSADSFYNLYNVNTQNLRGILETAAAGGAERSVNAQKIGDYYRACMNTDAIDADGLKPVQALLDQIDAMSVYDIATVAGKLQRDGVDVLFSYGEQQDLKDATKQIAFIDQGGLGMPERDFYLRTGAKDEELRKDYVAYITKILTLSGTPAAKAAVDAKEIMAFETTLAKASMDVTSRRDPEATYHLVPVADINKYFPMGTFQHYEEAVYSPRVTEINDANPAYIPALVGTIRATDIDVLRAYMRFHLLSTVAGSLPKAFDDASFEFYSHDLNGETEQRARWKRCSSRVDGALGEALGQVYVQQYFAGDSKARMLTMVEDIEHAMDRDIDTLDWMSATTKALAKEKLHLVANKIGYPDHWRDYSTLIVKPNDPVGNALRANAFESDRQLAKIGQPVDHSEWGMSPPTVNAYYNPSMNDINFPAGILQPNFYDAKADLAVNYGHIGAVIGHELTHGFDDEGKKFDGKGNLSDWWTPADTAAFEKKTDCEVNEYNQFVAIDDVHVNGKLTLGENTADNGGLLLAYMAYLERAKQEHLDTTAKLDGFNGPQRFYIAFAQNWCSNDRPESLRTGALTDPHSPDRLRVTGPLVNQPGFAAAFACKTGTPMVPVKSCRVW